MQAHIALPCFSVKRRNGELLVPTSDEWFNGRFWLEWMVGRKNKPTEMRSKESIYRLHLKDRIGDKLEADLALRELAKLIAELRAAGLGHQLTKAIGLRGAVIAAADAFTSKPETAP